MSEHPSFDNPMIPPGEPVPGKTYRANGWAYWDPPARFAPEIWDQMIEAMGPENYVLMAVSSGVHPSDGKPFVRGQILISPTGLANLTAYANATPPAAPTNEGDR